MRGQACRWEPTTGRPASVESTVSRLLFIQVAVEPALRAIVDQQSTLSGEILATAWNLIQRAIYPLRRIEHIARCELLPQVMQ